MSNRILRQPTNEDAVALYTMSIAQSVETGDTENLTVTEGSIRRDLLSHPDRYITRIIDVAGKPVGMFIAYDTYWVAEGTRGLYLESLYIIPEERGNGHADAVFEWLHDYAAKHDMFHIHWMGLRNNDQAQGFYTKMGAHSSEEWRIYSIPTRSASISDE